MAVRACDIVAGMHRLGVVIGDVNMANFMYDAAADPARLGRLGLGSDHRRGRGRGLSVVESLEKSPEMLEAGLGKAPLTSRSDDFPGGGHGVSACCSACIRSTASRDRPSARRGARRERALAREFSSAQHGVLPESAFGDDLALLFRRSFKGPYERVPGTEGTAMRCRRFSRRGSRRCARIAGRSARGRRGACPACRKRKKEAFMGGKLFRAAALLGVVVVASQVVDPAQLLDGAGALAEQGQMSPSRRSRARSPRSRTRGTA